MIFRETPLPGAFEIELEQIPDDRGFFARTWCRKEFQAHGLVADFVQCNISFNRRKGTLRGMHYQAEPHGETKLVRCIRGSIFDVIIDLRPGSLTFKKWFGVTLSAERLSSLYIPVGFAHGFLTLSDNSEVFYQMSEYYYPQCSKGVRWNDPALAVKWPFTTGLIISEKDNSYEDFGL